MRILRLTLHQLRPDDITNAVRDKNSRCHKPLLRLAGNIPSTQRYSKTNHGAKEAEQGVTGHRCNGLVAPSRLPNHHKACYDRQAAEYERKYADVWVM
jgi:hypothetical protein